MLVLRIARSDLQGWAVVVFTPQSRFFRRKPSLILTTAAELRNVRHSPSGRLILRATSDDGAAARSGWFSIGSPATESQKIRQPPTLSGIGTNWGDEKHQPCSGHEPADQPDADDRDSSWTDRRIADLRLLETSDQTGGLGRRLGRPSRGQVLFGLLDDVRSLLDIVDEQGILGSQSRQSTESLLQIILLIGQ
jgi:hypothetical protein